METMDIYVGNLDYQLTEDDIKPVFQAYGEVGSVKIITDSDTGNSRGFCFVEMPEKEEALKAIEALNGTDLGGKTITVNEARPKLQSKKGRGGPGGGRGGPSGGHGKPGGGHGKPGGGRGGPVGGHGKPGGGHRSDSGDGGREFGNSTGGRRGGPVGGHGKPGGGRRSDSGGGHGKPGGNRGGPSGGGRGGSGGGGRNRY